MDLQTILVGSISIFLCFLPFIIMNINKKRRENKILHSMNKLAQEQGCTITQHEFCSELVIGIDENKKFVFFCKKSNDKETAQFVNLSSIQQCSIIHTKDSETKVTEKIELCFTPIGSNKANQLFEIYNGNESLQLMGEIQLVNKWEKLINDKLKRLVKIKREAVLMH